MADYEYNAAMDKDLELFLEILNSARCLNKPKEAIIILEKITKCFSQEKSQFTMDLLISLLLNEENALFTFIWKMSAEFEKVSAVSAAFKLLDYVVTNYQKSIEPYFPFLFQKCLFLLSAKFAKVKESSLKLIKKMIIADSKHTLELSNLISALERHLREDTKTAGIVLDQIYSLLGYLFKRHPESVKFEKWFLNKMCDSVRQESTVKNSSASCIKGAFEGINGYLTNFSPPDAETLKKIYEYIKNWSKFREEKKPASRAALKILQNHWSNFSAFIHSDKEFWKINMEVWIKQKKEDQEYAFKFLCAFYSVIALFIKQKPNNLEIQNYLKEFTNTLESDANSYEKKAALVGIKLFVLTGSLTGDDFNKTYDLLENFIKKQETQKHFSCLPLGLECVSAFVLKFSDESFHVKQLAFLQRLSVKLIENYPTFETEFQPDVLTAFEKSFYMLGLSNLQVMENHVDRILYQGLIRTCSSMTLSELELLKEIGQSSNTIYYKMYFSLWKYLLTLASSPNLPIGGSFTLKKGVSVKVFDAFVNSFLKILSKLDFGFDSKVEIEKPSDFRIFINIVDLYHDLIPLIDPFSLQKWLTEIFKTVIHLSDENPLVSGFYRIVATSFKVADCIQFFDDCTNEKKKCFVLVHTFIESILSKIDQFKGDLRMACLKVLLVAPVSILEGFMEKIVPILEVIIHLARNSSSLLKDLIEALERWDFSLLPETSKIIMESVLPHFDVFFQSPYFCGKNSVSWSKAGKKVKNTVVFSDSEFLELQKNFLMFLGHLEISKSMKLIELSYNEEIRHISDKQLVYYLPCCDGLVELNLEEIIPRIIDLAESCGDRKTRITACELLYSMVLLILGNINQLNGGYTYLFRKVVKTCVMLGCDSDRLVWQIFEPLMYQITHYFSGKEALHFSETKDLIDILTNFVTCPYNPTVRDFSAFLLREFTVWSIKQLTPEELKVTPDSVKRILKKIHSLALHPSYNKRLGAAVLFNKIYSILREEEFILNAYWFELFYYFMESLRMCDGSENLMEITEAIEHVKRPLVEKCKEFNEDSCDRIVPLEFKGGRLCHLVKWTMEWACDIKPHTRHIAMALVQDLAPLVENCDSDMLFVSKQLQNFFQLKENLFHPDFKDDDFVHWLNYQNAGFEYCTWLLQQNVLTADELFQPKFKEVLKQFICGILSHGVSTIAISSLKQQSTLSFLKLLHALKEKAYLFPLEHWDLLKTAIFRPSFFGFDLNQASSTERLFSILTESLKYLSVFLTVYDWDNFYANVESIITAPVFNQISKNQSISTENLEFLFTLKVIESSGLWNSFTEKVFFSVKEDLFVLPIFKALFFERGKTVYAIGLEPSCKLYFEEILKVILKVSTDLKGVMYCLENVEEVVEDETGKTIKKGEFFQLLFKNVIFKFLESKHSLLIEWVLTHESSFGVKLLVQILEYQSEDSDFPLDIFVRWEDFENINFSDKSQKDKILFHLAVCGARLVGTPGFLKTSPIADKIYSILENRKLEEIDFYEIETIFSLLPYLSVFGEDLQENVRLHGCLSKIQIDLDVLKSNDPFYFNRAHFVLVGLLQSLKITGSLVVWNFIVSKANWFNSVCQKEEIESALSVFAENRTPMTCSLRALELAYDYCFGHHKTDFLPSIVYKLFLNPLMRVAPNPSVYHLVQRNIKNLCSLLTTHWGDDKNSMDILVNMSRKMCVAGVFQTFITKLTKDELDRMSQSKRQLMVSMVRKMFFFLKKPYPPLHLKERYRKLMCEIFNMICCIVSARCVDEKFYKLFIFDERGSFLFETIDKSLKYNFGMDFDEIPKRKKHLTILRKAITKESQEFSSKESIKYIQTNTLFTSSLREDVTRFDLTFSIIRPMNFDSEKETKILEIELEMDSLNKHECMATLVATITKMVRDEITSIDDLNNMPCWLNFFLNILKNYNFCNNLKLFVLKAIYNVQEYVTPFCEKVFPLLLEPILKLFNNHPINYFLIDLVEMMLGWKHVPDEEKSQLELTELVELIMYKSDFLRRDVVKYYLEILKTMIEVWKSGLRLSQLSALAFKLLSKSVENDVKANRNGNSETYLSIHTCGILLSNGIPAWKEGFERHFFNLILKYFENENKHNELFGEICGLALKHLQDTHSITLGEFEELVQKRISSQVICWTQLLYGVYKHYPKISSLFTFKIFSSAWDSTDSLTVRKLEMLLSHVSGSEVAEDPTFDRHAWAFILDMLNSPDVAVHELSLQIADKLLNKLDSDKLKVFMMEVTRLQKSVHPGVRKWVYEICKKLYQEVSCDFILKQCKVILLSGLNDDVQKLEEFCIEFWQCVLKFASSESALLKILKEMYTSETEDVFLSNTAKILLRCFADDYKSKTSLFPHPIIHRCKFRKRNLVLGPRQSFLLSLSSSGRTLRNESLEHLATVRYNNFTYLRPSLSSLKFQPTVQECLEESSTPNVSTLQDCLMPTNPYKRRFHKKEAKNYFSFVRWKEQKKKQEFEDDEKEAGNKESEVDIYGEYQEGDYPDIQISHKQIIKLLEVLAKRDHQIAKLFLVSFFSGLVKTLKSGKKAGFLSETSKCFEHILKSSANFDPGVIGFIFQVILNHRQLDINCQLISNAAISSNWISLGVLLIEQIIANKEGEDDEIPLKRRESENPEEIRWLELAKLYRSLEEFDVLTGIFLDKLRVVGDARDAILCESASNWQKALKLYESVLRTKPESSEREFYTESYLSCLAKLSNWSSLNKCVRTTVNNDLNDLWNNYNILSWFLKSEMMISLGTDKSDFRKILEEFCKKSVRESILSSNFGEEMTVFDWFSNNLQRASYRINKLCLDFLADWSHLDQWSYNLRAAKLSKLQTLSELSFAVRSLAEVSKSDLEQNIKLGLKRWEKNVPGPSDDLTIWDLKLCYRKEFFKHLKDFDLRAVEVKSNLAMAKAALNQYNLYMAKEYLSRAKEKLPAEDFDLKAEYNICFNLGKMALGKLRMKDENVGLEVYLNVWNGISKQISSEMETDSDSYSALAYSCNFILGQLISDILPCVKKQTVSPEILNSLCLKLKSSEKELMNALQRKGLEYFEAARSALENKACSPETKSNTYLELSKFFLKFPESGSLEKLCKYLLRSMCLGNSEARQLFGCVLNISQLPNEEFSFEEVISESERVPPWMFLMWINQMLASLNSKMFIFLRPILLRVTQNYPNAIRYALKLTEELKSFNPKAKSFLVRLYGIVSKDKIYDDFWNSLRYLAPPHLILNYYLEEALQETSQPKPNLLQIKKIILSLQELMFSASCSKFRGPIFKFWDKFKEPLEDLLTEFESKDVLKRKIKNIVASLESAQLPSRRVLGLLESYSPWLYKFHALKSDGTLELPGQYDGSREPIEKSLVTISSFKNSVLIYDSKCRPMRISILGNDAKEHKFLVKFGEDLRQDERIQQVFRHFNHRLKVSKQTRRLCLDTYKVIPLTLCLGLIEWVEDNVSLYEMMENSLGNESDAIIEAQRAHLSFLSQGSPLAEPGSIKESIAAHLIAYERIPRERAISNFRLRVNEFPRDLLKKSFLSLSSSSEHFMYLRGNFAISHAIVSITHWLIGIGDRHLQNTLVSKKTGRALGIDFGYAFGFATQFLTPPELIPFRLSPQILNLMHPLGESGSMKQTMIHCLRVFREESFRLRSVLDVFAQEPVMDWLKQAKKKPNYKSDNLDTWYPREKLSMVEKKLNGVNPVVVFEADLRAGHSEEKYLSKYLEVLKGVQRDNIRARCNEDGLTEEEQVECLIDLATDHHVLSKTYIGWNPWL